ncbi:MAG TPA: hypothetical protein VFZ66_13985 [Herpetosiphonaceae bacterium]
MAQNTSLTKEQAIRRLASSARRNARQCVANKAVQVAIVRKIALASGAGLIGGLKRAGVPNTIGDSFPWKLAAWPVLLVAEAFIPNDWISAIAGGLGDATLVTYTDRLIVNTADPNAKWYQVAGELP